MESIFYNIGVHNIDLTDFITLKHKTRAKINKMYLLFNIFTNFC